MPTITLDGQPVTVEAGTTLLAAAQAAGVYVPSLCTHPDLVAWSEVVPWARVYHGAELVQNDGPHPNPLPEGEGTGPFLPGVGMAAAERVEAWHLCQVEVEDERGVVLACSIQARDGMDVRTNSEAVQAARQRQLARLLARHPHICLTCPLREGCSREPCALGVPVEERCCPRLGDCQIQRAADFIGVPQDTPRYRPRDLPVVMSETAMQFDFNLCIGCTLCVRACGPLQGFAALGFVYHDGQAVFGTGATTLRASGCKFCGACVEVCPAGAIREKTESRYLNWRAKTQERLALRKPLQPPQKDDLLPAEPTTVAGLPEEAGVLQVLDGDREIICIAGAPSLRRGLADALAAQPAARYLRFEVNPLYTQRESELLQDYLRHHGHLPPGNELEDDLF